MAPPSGITICKKGKKEKAMGGNSPPTAPLNWTEPQTLRFIELLTEASEDGSLKNNPEKVLETLKTMGDTLQATYDRPFPVSYMRQKLSLFRRANTSFDMFQKMPGVVFCPQHQMFLTLPAYKERWNSEEEPTIYKQFRDGKCQQEIDLAFVFDLFGVAEPLTDTLSNDGNIGAVAPDTDEEVDISPSMESINSPGWKKPCNNKRSSGNKGIWATGSRAVSLSYRGILPTPRCLIEPAKYVTNSEVGSSFGVGEEVNSKGEDGKCAATEETECDSGSWVPFASSDSDSFESFGIYGNPKATY